jgi:hypothetical protein
MYKENINDHINRRKKECIRGRTYLPQVQQVKNINSLNGSKDFVGL